jgi:hypothetical protein
MAPHFSNNLEVRCEVRHHDDWNGCGGSQDLFENVRKLEQHCFAVGELSDVYKCLLIKSNRQVTPFVTSEKTDFLIGQTTGCCESVERHFSRRKG